MKTDLSELTLELTQSCPNKCQFCSSYAKSSLPPILKLDTIQHVIADATELGIREVALSGGEPLCVPFIEQIIANCLKNKRDIALFTCGQRFEQAAQSVIVPFVDWNILIPNESQNRIRLVFNIQSADAVIHDSLAKSNGSYERSWKSLSAARDAGFSTEINLVPNAMTAPTLRSTIEKFLDYGVKRIHLLRMVEQGYYHENKSSLELSALELIRIINSLHAHFENDPRVRFGIPLSQNGKRCTAGINKLVVRYDGEILPCEAFKDDGYVARFSLGNVAAGGTLLSAWNKAKDHLLLCSLRGDLAEKCQGWDSCIALRFKTLPG